MTEEKEFIPLNLRPLRELPEIKTEANHSWIAFFLVFLVLFVFFMMISEVYVEKYRQIQEERSEIVRLESEVKILAEENREIQNNIESLKTDSGQEKIARRRLKLIRPDEFIVEWETSQ